MPYSVDATCKILLYPQYWQDVNMIQKSYSFQSDSITVTGTKAKLLAAISIVTSVFNPADTTNPLIYSTLFNDACQEKSMSALSPYQSFMLQLNYEMFFVYYRSSVFRIVYRKYQLQ